MRNYDVQFGPILMLDALGARSFGIPEAINFLAVINQLESTLKSFRDGLIKAYSNPIARPYMEAKGIFLEAYNYDITIFQDTLVLSWNCPKEELDRLLLSMPLSFDPVLKFGFDQRRLFRGALTVGEYVKGKNMILGTAINDVAKYYEKARWSGIIATPSCAEKIKSALSQWDFSNPEKNTYPFFIEYDVPEHNNERKIEFNRRFVFPWPAQYLSMGCQAVNNVYEDSFYKSLKLVQREEKDEDIYSNTIEYFDWFKSNVDMNFYNQNFKDHIAKPWIEYSQDK